MSADITYLTIGGTEKKACQTGDVAIELGNGQTRMHGQLSWAFGESLIDAMPDLHWGAIVFEMTQLIHLQHLELELFFHGQPTAQFNR